MKLNVAEQRKQTHAWLRRFGVGVGTLAIPLFLATHPLRRPPAERPTPPAALSHPADHPVLPADANARAAQHVEAPRVHLIFSYGPHDPTDYRDRLRAVLDKHQPHVLVVEHGPLLDESPAFATRIPGLYARALSAQDPASESATVLVRSDPSLSIALDHGVPHVATFEHYPAGVREKIAVHYELANTALRLAKLHAKTGRFLESAQLLHESASAMSTAVRLRDDEMAKTATTFATTLRDTHPALANEPDVRVVVRLGSLHNVHDRLPPTLPGVTVHVERDPDQPEHTPFERALALAHAQTTPLPPRVEQLPPELRDAYAHAFLDFLIEEQHANLARTDPSLQSEYTRLVREMQTHHLNLPPAAPPDYAALDRTAAALKTLSFDDLLAAEREFPERPSDKSLDSPRRGHYFWEHLVQKAKAKKEQATKTEPAADSEP